MCSLAISEQSSFSGPGNSPGKSLFDRSQELISFPDQYTLFYSLCREFSLDYTIVIHEASISALEKQAILSVDVVVQKSLTIKMAGKCYLVTGLGDFFLPKSLFGFIGRQFGHTRAQWKSATINPAGEHPADLCGLYPGIVSPFSRHPYRVPWDHFLPSYQPSATQCAISLSVTTSLIVPIVDLLFCFNHTDCSFIHHFPVFYQEEVV